MIIKILTIFMSEFFIRYNNTKIRMLIGKKIIKNF